MNAHETEALELLLEIRRLIGRSSLGTREVQILRSRTPERIVDLIISLADKIAGARGVSGPSRHIRDPDKQQPSDGQKDLAMSKSTRNTGKPWAPSDTRQLRNLANENTPTRVIGLKLGRTEGAVRNQASQQDISLKPTNQSPYNRRSK
jgi:hypothetical protein